MAQEPISGPATLHDDGIWEVVQAVEDRFASGQIGREQFTAQLVALWSHMLHGDGAAAVFRNVLSETDAAVRKGLAEETYLDRVEKIWLQWLLADEGPKSSSGRRST